MTQVAGAVGGLLVGTGLVLWWRGQSWTPCPRKPLGLSLRVNRAGEWPVPWRRRWARLYIPTDTGTFREWFAPLPFNGVLCLCWVPVHYDESQVVPEPAREYVCPGCKVERVDYEGPGAHLPACPNCQSTKNPVPAPTLPIS